MSFSRMKPLPKFIIVGSVVALIVFGAKLALDRVPAKEATPAVAVTQMPAETATAPVAVAPPVVEVPTTAVPVEPAAGGLTPAGGQDAGLKAVLKAGAK